MKNHKKINSLSINETKDGYVIYDKKKDKVHFLNNTAVFVLELCTGEFSTEQIAELMQKSYSLKKDPIKGVTNIIEEFKNQRLLQ